MAAHIKIKLRLVSEPERRKFMERVDADIIRLDSCSRLANVSGHIDATTTVAQTGISVAQTYSVPASGLWDERCRLMVQIYG